MRGLCNCDWLTEKVYTYRAVHQKKKSHTQQKKYTYIYILCVKVKKKNQVKLIYFVRGHGIPDHI